jgi:uncharacterized protein YwlG (UPF0340 family)
MIPNLSKLHFNSLLRSVTAVAGELIITPSIVGISHLHVVNFRVSCSSRSKWFIFTSHRGIKNAIVSEHVTADNLLIAIVTIVPECVSCACTQTFIYNLLCKLE